MTHPSQVIRLTHFIEYDSPIFAGAERPIFSHLFPWRVGIIGCVLNQTHTHTHTHTHAHPITVIWVFLKDPNSLPNWSIRARSFWTSGILETSICIFAKGSFFFLAGSSAEPANLPCCAV